MAMYVKLRKNVSLAEVFDPYEYDEDDAYMFCKGEEYEVLRKLPTEIGTSGVAYVIFDGYESVTVDAGFVVEVDE